MTEFDSSQNDAAQTSAQKGWGWKRFKNYWWDIFFGPYDVINWKIFQTIFGIAWLNWFAGYVPTIRYWISTGGFHISTANASGHYAEPAPLVPPEYVVAFTAVYLVCILLNIFGIWRKVLVWVMFWGAVYTQAVDQPSAFTLSKLFIVYFFLVGIAPQPEKRPGASDDEPLVMSAWPVRLIQLSLLIEYMEADSCKIFLGDWIFKYSNGSLYFSNMDPLWGFTQGLYKNFFAAWVVNVLSWRPFWILFSLSAVAFEVFAPVLFLWRKTRYPVAIIYGICMHIGIAVLMKDLIYFSLQMITFYIFWIRAEHTRMVLLWLRDRLLPKSIAARLPI
ncbi:MAG: hypothetical protein GY822_27000 [Deltaproteobacteria bacterium]|nr:hypothetical protein [Deltaproteobacteria bacterium]